MKAMLALPLLLAFVLPAPAQVGRWYPGRYPPPPPPVQVVPRDRVPDLDGTWYMNGDPNKPCEIIQQGSGRRAEFINEHDSSAWGTIRGDRVWIPDWSDGYSQGLEGRIRGNRIVWPDGNFWSR